MGKEIKIKGCSGIYTIENSELKQDGKIVCHKIIVTNDKVHCWVKVLNKLLHFEIERKDIEFLN